MAKRRKKKSGLHKAVSAVLKGVPIPQGVHNWRPADKSTADCSGDSNEVPDPDVSSVFKGVSVPIGDIAQPTAETSPEDCRAKASPTNVPGDCRTSRPNPMKQREPLEESPAKSGRTGEQTAAGRVVCYHDPAKEVPRLSLRLRIWEKLFGTKN